MKMTKKFSKRVENTVGKGEIARYEQFLLFPLCFQNTFQALFQTLCSQCFQRPVLQTLKNQGLFGKGLIRSFERDI